MPFGFYICVDLPGLKPWLVASKRASQNGSRAFLTTASIILFLMVGIPSGLVLFGPLGISTLRAGGGFHWFKVSFSNQ